MSDAGSHPTWANGVDRREEWSKAGQPTRGAVAVDRSAASQFAGGGPAAGKPAASRPGGRGFEAGRSAAGQSVSFDYASRMGTVRERARQALKVQMPSKPVLVAIAVLMVVCIVLGVVAVRGVFDTGVVITRGSDYVTQSNGDESSRGSTEPESGSEETRLESGMSAEGSGTTGSHAGSDAAGSVAASSTVTGSDTMSSVAAGAGVPGVSVRSTDSADIAAPDTVNDAYICIYVSGSVINPGVYNLAEGSRVYEAIEMAGGAAPGADLASINLAKPLTDAEMVYVPAEGEAPSASYAAGAAPMSAAGGAQGSGLVNINTAGVEELKTLNGIGDSLAQAIVDDRERNGPFTSVDDLVRVSGIGAKTLARFADKVCV